MKIIQVNTDSIARAKKVAAESLDALRESLVSMRASVDELNATWEGPNHDKFVRQFSEDYAEMERFCNTLGLFIEQYGESGHTYAVCDQDVAGLVAF